MIDVIKQQFTAGMPDNEKLNRIREFLQLACLKFIYDKGIFNKIAFTGGTALRLIFGMRRFSEDLDFSLFDKKGYSFSELNSEILRGFSLNGIKVESAQKEEKTVHSALFKFSGVLKATGLSPLDGQKLSIKLEIDTNPPKGGNLTETLVNKVYVLNLVHFDLPSLFATKLHACFYRKYLKGRDYYDLIWYLSRKVKPNLLLLNNAIAQTQGENPRLDEAGFKKFLLEHVKKVDLSLAKKDVERFLEDKAELALFDSKAIQAAIENVY